MKKAAAFLLALLLIFSASAASAGAKRSYTFPVSLFDPDKMRDFVAIMYLEGLGREADDVGLESWTNMVLAGDISPEDLIKFFLTSEEMETRGLSNADFVRVLYTVYLWRDADEAGLASFTGVLDGGMKRTDLMDFFASTEEYLGNRQGLEVGVWEETELYKLNYLNKKKGLTPAACMATTEDQAMMASMIFIEANRGISETLDMNFERLVYTGLDKDDYGFAAYPLSRNGGYHVYCWQGSMVMDWGKYTDEQLPALLRMMKEVHEFDIFDFQDVLDNTRTELFKQ